VERRFADRYPQRPQSTAEPSADIVAFWSAVRELPSRPRIVVSLYFGADRSTAEIASILDVPEGTVRSDLTRARQVLAAQLRG
jgi:RNA polymerase sigma-70 factor (ECF subfamily)